jgi:curved DNA-binding protein CbpA
LYEILGAQPTDTRADLKKRYAIMARLTHPDAIKATNISSESTNNNNNGIGSEGNSSSTITFQEIADAWRVLGDSKLRKRYDRELQAKAWSEMAQKYTNDKLEKAVPVALDMMDRVAFPFLRRTTATTLAVGQAIASGVSTLSGNNNNNNKSRSSSSSTTTGSTKNGRDDGKINNNTNQNTSNDPNQQQQQYSTKPESPSSSSSLTAACMSAVEAGQKAGRMIDSIELNEKSNDLEKRYVLIIISILW